MSHYFIFANIDPFSNKIKIKNFFFSPMPPHVLVDLVVLPPGHGSSVTDF